MPDGPQGGEPPPPPPPPPAWPAPPGWAQPPYAWGQPPYGWYPQVPAQVGSGRFRSMNVGELLDAVFTLYRRNFVLIAAISAVVEVPYAALQFVLYQVSGFSSLQSQIQNASQFQNPDTAQQQLQTLTSLVGNLVLVSGILGLVSFFIVLPLATAATTRAVADRYLDRPTSIRASYASALRRLGPLILQSLILLFGFGGAIAAALFATIGLALISGGLAVLVAIPLFIGLIVGAVFVYVKTSLAAPAIVLERVSGWRGLVRSWNLVRGMFWRILGIRLLMVLITAIITAVVVTILTLAAIPLDANGRFVVQEVASAIAAVFIGPVTYITVTLLYYDARIRKEAFDIEMLAESL